MVALNTNQIKKQTHEKQPNLFIVGAPKCATSSLAAYLSEHPNLFLCEPKEPFFWCEDYPGLRRRLNLGSLDDYLDLFATATDQHTVLAEGSTNYLRSEVAVESILDFNPNAKFIAMLRDPVQVAHAFHAEVLFSAIEDEPDFETAWRLQTERKAGRRIPAGCEAPQFLQYAEVASYADQLERFFRLVPERNRQVILMKDFASDTRAVFDQCVGFLGLPDFEMKEFPRVNAAHDHRFRSLANLVLNPPSALRPLIESTRGFLRRSQFGPVERLKHLLRKPQKRTPLSIEFHNELCDFFTEDIARTSGILNVDLSHWAQKKPTSTIKTAVPVSV